MDLWLRRYNRFRRQLYATAALSVVDGAVVFDSELRLLGFGGEILVDESTASKSQQTFTDATTDNPLPSQNSSSFGGTRHRSAYRLCKTVAGSLAFVVSQDGELTVFYSKPGKVFAFGSLAPAIIRPNV